MASFHDDFRLLFKIAAANLQSTADQQFTKVGDFINYMPTRIVARRVTGGASVACTGGIYASASKAGDQLVSVAQSWLGVSGAGKLQDATVAAVVATDVHTTTPYLSLTTGSTAAVTADVYIYGVILD